MFEELTSNFVNRLGNQAHHYTIKPTTNLFFCTRMMGKKLFCYNLFIIWA